MAKHTLLQMNPPRNGQSGSGWSEEEEYSDTVLYEEGLGGPDEWEDDEDQWEEIDEYDWEDDEDEDDWDDDDWDDDYDYDEDEDQ
jgi:hypothetical protein